MATYELLPHAGSDAFLDHASEWLLEREDLNNLVLSLALARASSSIEEEPDALFATVERDGRIVGCVLRTPPYKVLLTDLPVEAAPAVAEGLVSRYEEIPAFLGPEPVAEAVAAAWVERRGGSRRPGMPQRIYRLDAVTPPEGVPGRMRLAASDDVELAFEWGRSFVEDAGVHFSVQRWGVERWIESRSLFLWEDEGAPRSMAVASGRTPTGVRVGLVYTPPGQRRRGYASACVAAVSQHLLDDGYSFCVLYTDLRNATSNAIYRRMGYERIGDVRDIDVIPEEPRL